MSKSQERRLAVQMSDRLYVGYPECIAKHPAIIKRITPLWQLKRCISCGQGTYIGPSQVNELNRHGGDVSCMLCSIAAGVSPDDIQSLDDKHDGGGSGSPGRN